MRPMMGGDLEWRNYPGACPHVPVRMLTTGRARPYVGCMTDPLVTAVHQAYDAHAAAIKTGDTRAMLIAYRAVQVATVALAVDCGEDPSAAIFEIEDCDRDLARIAAN